MDERDIEMLLALAKAKSISYAAELLFINQSSLSKRLHALEGQLDQQLVIRSNTGILFTPAGLAALTAARQIQRITQNLHAALGDPSTPLHGNLVIGCSLDFAQFALAPILSRFHAAYPNIALTINTGYSRNIYQRVLADECDLGIVRGDFYGSLAKSCIATDTVYLINQQPLMLADLAHLPFISRRSDVSFQNAMQQWLSEHHLNPAKQTIMSVDNLASSVEFVAAGLGWALAPGLALRHFTGFRQPLTLAGKPFTRNTYLVQKAPSQDLPQARAFTAICQDTV
ncbi:LysR family transcriptional regulator [Lacticaseibacillus baoqingensis]|uniref:LysR family transcriptional regulator n=1 Tax=Lacticaseibacillus baoqingensis TaxID=2486013 RepID=A0ABW4E6N1_9LACO|nr:LysR family transcriptional regulator [Lacticaseibacillus baoqingensis]